MSVTIKDTGLLKNQNAGPDNPGDEDDNPMETEEYEFIVRIEYPDTTDVGAWEISGEFPEGLSWEVNASPEGLKIFGTINGMWDQPLCVPKKDLQYPEIDCRKYPGKTGRYVNDFYDFEFKTKVNWTDNSVSPPYVSYTEVDHTIRLVKDFSYDVIGLFKPLLDGTTDRDPNHCSFSGPKNQSQCEEIGGTWDPDLEVCSIGIPQNQADCESVGGTWEDGACNIALIKTQTECELIGGTWKKNTLISEGTEYDNSTDFLLAIGLGDKNATS